jgi:hypothetical protein
MTMTSRRKTSTPAPTVEQLGTELADAHAQIAELRIQLRAVAALTVGNAFRTAPQSANRARLTTVRDVCSINSVAHLTDVIAKLLG